MMDKNEHINYWIKLSEEDWETVVSLLNGGRYVHCLFFAHLTLEKICKALWVNYNESNIPPKSHNLVKLIQESQQNLDENELAFLAEFNEFQLEGRYPDYVFSINQICTLEYTKILLVKVEEIKKCLLGKLY